MTVQDTVIIIGAVFAGLALLMNTWLTAQTRGEVSAVKKKQEETAAEQSEQLEVIHKNGNKHLELLTAKLQASEDALALKITESDERRDARIDALERELAAKR